MNPINIAVFHQLPKFVMKRLPCIIYGLPVGRGPFAVVFGLTDNVPMLVANTVKSGKIFSCLLLNYPTLTAT